MLQRRPGSGIYYFRQRVPERLRDVLEAPYTGKREIVRSLRTNDLATAKRAVRLTGVEVDAIFARAEERLKAASTPPVETMEQAEADRWAALWLVEQLDNDRDRRSNPRALTWFDTELLTLPAWELRDLVARADTSLLHRSIDGFLERHGLRLTAGSPAYRALAFSVLRAAVKGKAIIASRNKGEWLDAPPVPAPVVALGGAPAAPLGVLQARPAALSGGQITGTGETIGKFVERWKAANPQSVQADYDVTATIRRFTELHGDVPIDAISKPLVRSFRDAMVKVPSRLPNKMRALPLPELLEKTKDMPGERLRPASVVKALGNISRILSWASSEGYFDHLPAWANPTSGITVSDPVAAEDKRAPYSIDDLKAIFSSPVYAGHAMGDRNRPGPVITRDAFFWLPLLALFTGARLEELGQLLVEDVGEVEGIPFLDINTRGDKRLKTRSSARAIPLHPELIRIGFLAHVAERKRADSAANAQLFPDLKVSNGKGKLTAGFSKWWGRYAREVAGIADRDKVFHSFRHAFADAMVAAGPEKVSPAAAKALLGHADPSVTAIYGSGLKTKVPLLNAALVHVEYPGLDLGSHGHALKHAAR